MEEGSFTCKCHMCHLLIRAAGFKTGQTAPKSQDSLTIVVHFKIKLFFMDVIDGHSSYGGWAT